MPSNVQKISSSSVVIKSIDLSAIQRAVKLYVTQMRKEHPEIERVIWFGSWVTGLPTPGSDVDLCLILSSAGKPRHERISDYLPVGFPVGVDLLTYTRAEFVRMRQESPSLYAAIVSGQEL